MGGSTTQPEQYFHDLPHLQNSFMVIDFYQVLMRLNHVLGLQVVEDTVCFSTMQAFFRAYILVDVPGGVRIVLIPRPCCTCQVASSPMSRLMSTSARAVCSLWSGGTW